MNEEKQDLFNSLHDGLDFIATQGQIDDFILSLNKNGLEIIEKKCDCEPFQPCEKCAIKYVKPMSYTEHGYDYNENGYIECMEKDATHIIKIKPPLAPGTR